MTARLLFLDMMTQRRQFSKGSYEHAWMTRAARHYLWLMRGVPTTEWTE